MYHAFIQMKFTAQNELWCFIWLLKHIDAFVVHLKGYNDVGPQLVRRRSRTAPTGTGCDFWVILACIFLCAPNKVLKVLK